MAQYLFVYHGGSMPESEAEVANVMAQWQAWLGGLGDAVVNPGNPVGQSYTVTTSGVEDNGGANPASGFSIVKAASLDDALAMAKGCPHLLAQGSVEVAEVIEL